MRVSITYSHKNWLSSEKRGIIECAKSSFGKCTAIDHKSRFSAQKSLKYDNISYETGGGATQCTKSDFEPKRDNAHIKNKWYS